MSRTLEAYARIVMLLLELKAQGYSPEEIDAAIALARREAEV